MEGLTSVNRIKTRTVSRWHTIRQGAVLMVSLVAIHCGCIGMAAERMLNVRQLGVVRVKGSDDIRLEDVGPKGRALILNRVPDSQNPDLLLWDPVTKAFVKVVKPDWSSVPQPEWIPFGGPHSLRMVDRRGDIIGALGYYLVLLNMGRGTVRRILCSPELKDPKSPYANRAGSASNFVRGVVIARDKYTGVVAAAFNYGKWPRLFLLRPPWNAPCASWRMDRFVRALAWSPDGKTLGVLYSGAFNNKLKIALPGWYHVREPQLAMPDVALIDVKTGKTRLKFFSGDFETSIAFSPNGKFIYCAGDLPSKPRHGWVVREFAASTGKLVREFKERGNHLKGGLAVSPNGKFLVVDANSTAWSPGVFFNDVYGYHRRFRFIILDTATGRVLFEHSKRLHNRLFLSPAKFVFSPNGTLLYVDPRLDFAKPAQIKVYSVGGSPLPSTQ